MKKGIIILFSFILSLSLAACSEQETDAQNNQADQPRLEENTTPNSPEGSGESQAAESQAENRELLMVVDGQEINITLYNTPAANALYDMLPLTLDFEDFNGAEKISYLPEELPTQGEPDGCDPEIGDLCLYAPWGNLCIFYQDSGYSGSLIPLGRIESGLDIIAGLDSNFSATLEKKDGEI